MIKIKIEFPSAIIKVFGYLTGNSFLLIFFMTLLNILRNLVISFIFRGLCSAESSDNKSINDLSFEKLIIVVVIIGPVLETIIFHFLLLELLLYIFSKNSYRFFIVVVISSLLFSLTHNFSAYYLITTFLGGIIYSTSYIIAKNKNMIPFFVVFLIHSISNLAAILMNHFT